MSGARCLQAGLVATTVGVVLAVGALPAVADHTVTTDRTGGANRFATAAEIAATAFPSGADTALIARADDFADALAAAPLARAAPTGPVLLTGTDSVPAVTTDALDDLGVTEVVLLGGTGAISEAVEDDLDADYPTVRRVAGSTRFATAAEIAGEIDDAAGSDIGELDGLRTAFVASGGDFPDALAAGAPAAAPDDPLPILLTEQSQLSTAAADAVTDRDIEQAVIVGGEAAVSEQVATDLSALGVEVRRLAGANRLATAARVADFTVANFAAEGDDVQLARGDLFPDALTAGPYAGLTDAPILLAATPTALGTETTAWLDRSCLLMESVEGLGGTAALSPAVLAEAADVAEGCHGTWATLPEAPTGGRLNHSADWSGSEMLVWGGGTGDQTFDDGAAWEPAGLSWSPIGSAPILQRWGHESAWTGSELVVFGGSEGPTTNPACRDDGARYDPAGDTWSPLAAAPTTGRCSATSVWTGSELIVFGGSEAVPPSPGEAHDDAVRYDPAADSWATTPPAPMGARLGAVSVWTGSEMLVYGGSDETVTPSDAGAVYDPASDSWSAIADSSPELPPMFGVDGAWTGSELIAFGGSGSTAVAAYDPAADAWSARAAMPGPHTEAAHAWTGSTLYVVGGDTADPSQPVLAAYDPGADSWTALPDPPGGARTNHTAVWTGDELLVWGGQANGSPAPAVTWRP